MTYGGTYDCPRTSAEDSTGQSSYFPSRKRLTRAGRNQQTAAEPQGTRCELMNAVEPGLVAHHASPRPVVRGQVLAESRPLRHLRFSAIPGIWSGWSVYLMETLLHLAIARHARASAT